MSETLSISEKLNQVWKKVDDLFLPNNSWLTNRGKCQTLQRKLSYFNADHKDHPKHIDQVYQFLNRGVNLTQAAIDWENPAICGSPYTETGKLRGVQWRLVIAYSGFEITTRALINDFKNRRLKLRVLKLMMDKCHLPQYSPLHPPIFEDHNTIEKWLSREDKAIVQFLGLGGEDAQVIKRWMLEFSPIQKWKDAFNLAKAFRNTITHGFLVPSQVQEWKLEPSLNVLTENLAEILVAALEKLES